MSAPARHAENVSALASTMNVAPITGDAVPDVGGERIEAARNAARSEADERAGELVALREAQAACRERSADAEAGLAREQAALEAHLARRQQLQEDAQHLPIQIESIEQRADELRAEIDQWRLIADTADDVRRALITVIERVDAQQLPESETTRTGDELESIAGRLRMLDLGDHVQAILDWADALRSDTAPLHPEAAATLDALAALEHRWAACGSGNPGGDPRVATARSEVLAAKDALEGLETQARSGALGERLRRSIESAHSRRVLIESDRRKADPEALRQAFEDERLALEQVGFDSMLDFRIAMSSTGGGALADIQRVRAQERLSAAEATLEASIESSRVDAERVASERALLDEQARALAGTTIAEDAYESLRRSFDIPEPVQHALDEVLAATDGSTLRHETLVDELARTEEELRRISDELAAVPGAMHDVEADVESANLVRISAEEALDEANAALAAEDEAVRDGESRLASATERLEMLERRRYLPVEVDEVRDALLDSISAAATFVSGQPDGPQGVLVDDPLDVLDVEDALDVYRSLASPEWGVPVVYVTSRPELLAVARSLPDTPGRSSMRCVDGRRRARRGGRRLLRRHADPPIAS